MTHIGSSPYYRNYISPPLKENSQAEASGEAHNENLILRTNQAVSRWRGGDLALGLVNSRIFRSVVLSGLCVGGLFLTYFLLGMGYPPPWMISAAAAGGFVVGLIIQLPLKGHQKNAFEMSAIARLFKTNYNEIYETKGGKIFLGALPNRLRSDGEHLVNDEKVGAVLSVNERWERTPRGLSLPYTKKDWNEMGVNYSEMDVLDHTLLTGNQLNQAAEFIHEQLMEGRNVYIHCRAGVGRSAMCVAAYLIKYEGSTPQEACDIIKTHRPQSTIHKKLDRLNDYYYKLNMV